LVLLYEFIAKDGHLNIKLRLLFPVPSKQRPDTAEKIPRLH